MPSSTFIHSALPSRQRRPTRPSPPLCTAARPQQTTPVHRRLPYIGFVLDVLLNRNTPPSLAQRYGPVYHSDFAGTPVTVITDLQAITAAFKDDATFNSRSAWPANVRALLGSQGLFNFDGQALRDRRAPIQHVFSPAALSQFFPQLAEASRQLWHNLDVAASARRAPTVGIAPFCKDHLLRVFLRLTTGSILTPNADFDVFRSRFVDMSEGIFSIPYSPAWWKSFKARDAVVTSFRDLIRHYLSERGAAIDALRAAPNIARERLKSGDFDLLTLLVALSPLPTGTNVQLEPTALQEVAQLMCYFCFVGIATQATVTQCCVMELGMDKSIHDRLRAEQDRIMAENGGSVDVTPEQVTSHMPLLDSYIHEVLRVHPPVPSVFRRAARDVVVCGHEIEEGRVVMFDIWAAQMDGSYYDQPDVLQMDRFLQKGRVGEERTSRQTAIVSFGGVGGGHYCLGASLALTSLKLVLCTLLREWDLVLDPGQSTEYIVIPETRPASGVQVVSCSRRDRNSSVAGLE